MALWLMLGENHTPPEHLVVNAACTLDEIDGAPRITTVELTVRARVPGLEQASFEHTARGRPLPGLRRAARKRRDQAACELEQ